MSFTDIVPCGWVYGHPVACAGCLGLADGSDQLFYEDGEAVPADDVNRRCCVVCGLNPTSEGDDPCIARLPGAAYACCGHGVAGLAYIPFATGLTVRWENAPSPAELREAASEKQGQRHHGEDGHQEQD